MGGALGACCFGDVSSRFSETLADLICFMKGTDGSGRSRNPYISIDDLRFAVLGLIHFSVSRQPSPKKHLHSPETNQSRLVRR